MSVKAGKDLGGQLEDGDKVDKALKVCLDQSRRLMSIVRHSPLALTQDSNEKRVFKSRERPDAGQ